MINSNCSKKKYKEGVSIIELLIVMTIFAVIATVGINAIRSFRVASELSSASQQFESTLENIRNSSRNNVLCKGISYSQSNPNYDPFEEKNVGYLIHFEPGSTTGGQSNPYEIYCCSYDTTNSIYDCSTRSPAPEAISESISLNVTSSGGSPTCDGVFFENFTSDMKILNNISTGSLSSINESNFDNPAQQCEIELVHEIRVNNPNKYKFDSNEDTITK